MAILKKSGRPKIGEGRAMVSVPMELAPHVRGIVDECRRFGRRAGGSPVPSAAPDLAIKIYRQVLLLRRAMHGFDNSGSDADFDVDEIEGLVTGMDAVKAQLHELTLLLASERAEINDTGFCEVRVVFSDQEFEKIQRLAEEWDCEPSEAVSRLVTESLGKKAAAD